ncbi:MAG: hypothetical protein ACO34E_11090, partial [Limisphaerales bacterium]
PGQRLVVIRQRVKERPQAGGKTTLTTCEAPGASGRASWSGAGELADDGRQQSQFHGEHDDEGVVIPKYTGALGGELFIMPWETR